MSYWAVIPAPVRSHPDLSDRAKLLYAEISSLADSGGYCWATDAYFAEKFGCSIVTISRTIRQLRQAGFIRVEQCSNRSGTERHLYCGIFPAETPEETPQGGLIKFEGTLTSDKTPLIKNDKTPPSTPYKRNNKKKEGNSAPPRVLKPELYCKAESFCGEDDQLLQDILDFAEMRKAKGKPLDTPRMLSILLGKLQRFSGGDHEIMHLMLEKAIDGHWQTVYPLKADELPERQPEETEGRYREWRPR